ncbi:hypothetical protein CFK41_06685 [Brachybacterium ginsengisoli]|uniref:Pr6Pr family membrane protein n=1 Tax=Brachybacterium ginsengisoli TaxID=1331682 RepID=A0A291GWH2_9MICO|nr:Pr6Pr family membrane protein [Brachybacterium ginsengisoli]ATG54486.1 hypothetical protein CFK41_06685 [Brachybacterium ginsengisoli]
MTTVWPYLRLAAAALGAAAILRQLAIAVGNARAAEGVAAGQVGTVVANFFSYFTIISNLCAVVVLVLLGVRALRRRDVGVDPAWLATLLVCASAYMIVTGVVYNLLLRSIPIAGISDVWTNETLHLIAPLFLLIDVLVGPQRRALPWRAVLVAAVLPVLWVLYTMIRANFVVGPATGDPWWYPYPFLDPHLVPGGYVGVAGYIVGIAAVILGVAAGVVAVGRRRGRRDTNQGARASASPSTGADRPAGN